MSQSQFSKIVAQLQRSFGFGKTEDNPTDSTVQLAIVRTLVLTVVTTKGRIVTIETQENETGRNVKVEALQKLSELSELPYFSTSEITTSMVNHFKLIRVSNNKTVEDDHVLQQLKVKNNEQFLLAVKRKPIYDENFVISPTEDEIWEKTGHLQRSPEIPEPTSPKIILELMRTNNIELDVKRIFITLAQEAAYVLALSPYGEKIIIFYRQKILNYLKHHKDAFKVLCTLGFPDEKVKIALKLKANNSTLALDWLIENATIELDQSNLPDVQNTPRVSSDSYNNSISSVRRDSVLSSKYTSSILYKDRIDALLEIVRFYSEMQQIVPQESVNMLTRMGFETESAREALTITYNNKPAAIDWLLGNRGPSLTEFSQGFTTTSIIRQIILKSDEVQASLTDPKIFATFMSVLNHPSPTNMWSIDIEIGHLMQHIISTYHEEKNYLAINQFNDSKYPVSALSAPQN